MLQGGRLSSPIGASVFSSSGPATAVATASSFDLPTSRWIVPTSRWSGPTSRWSGLVADILRHGDGDVAN
ncbi:hypothetical protein HYQ46_009127 [Verticillium longisporum]|nr:hypothetical protein HYQ46_009127 [Verticillium longisporum]